MPIPRPVVDMAPLSSFAAPAKNEELLRAALEVESLAWPKICGELLSRSRRRWDRFAEQLTERIAQGETCIALASCERGAGRTTVALTAARCLGARGVRTLVVDADFENPNLAETCGMAPHTGWSEVIEGRRPLGEALIAAVGDAVTLMPWLGRGQHVARPSDTLRMGTHFARLKQHYDLIVLDAMPLAGPQAVSNFARLAAAIPLDAVYLVADARVTTSEQLADTCAKLARAGAAVTGIIENFSAYANLNDASPREKPPTSAGKALATQG